MGGGTWTYRISSDDDNKNKLDTAWFNTVLTMIGDQFDDADDICGVVVSKRGNTNRLGLWVKHADDREAVKRIGKQLKDFNRTMMQNSITNRISQAKCICEFASPQSIHKATLFSLLLLTVSLFVFLS